METRLDDETLFSETDGKFGWHAGFEGELQLGGHAGVRADSRYTFLGYE